MYDIDEVVESKATLGQVLGGLRREGAVVVASSPERIAFRSRLIQFNWNLLAPVSSGVVQVDSRGIRYSLDLFRCRAICFLFSVCVLAYLPWLPNRESHVIFAFGSVLSWAILYGVNRNITAERFRVFIENAGSEQPHRSGQA